jgi:hypothetical protein
MDTSQVINTCYSYCNKQKTKKQLQKDSVSKLKNLRKILGNYTFRMASKNQLQD